MPPTSRRLRGSFDVATQGGSHSKPSSEGRDRSPLGLSRNATRTPASPREGGRSLDPNLIVLFRARVPEQEVLWEMLVGSGIDRGDPFK